MTPDSLEFHKFEGDLQDNIRQCSFDSDGSRIADHGRFMQWWNAASTEYGLKDAEDWRQLFRILLESGEKKTKVARSLDGWLMHTS